MIKESTLKPPEHNLVTSQLLCLKHFKSYVINNKIWVLCFADRASWHNSG